MNQSINRDDLNFFIFRIKDILAFSLLGAQVMSVFSLSGWWGFDSHVVGAALGALIGMVNWRSEEEASE